MRIINPMDYAIKLANKCKRNGEVPVGCVIVDDQGNIVTCNKAGLQIFRVNSQLS